MSNEQVPNALKARVDLKRRWLYLMPIVFFTYSLAYLGRSNFGFGAAAGLAKSLNITESRAAFLGSVFFIGYFFFQIPAASYARRRSAARLIFWALLSWGILSGLPGVIRGALEEAPLRPVFSPENPPPHLAGLLGALDRTWHLLEPLLPKAARRD